MSPIFCIDPAAPCAADLPGKRPFRLVIDAFRQDGWRGLAAARISIVDPCTHGPDTRLAVPVPRVAWRREEFALYTAAENPFVGSS
ncbi:MAG: hypothetical protein CL819_06860 [Croceicoccus sp.]|nr:hypothetical protein [Croceicoccus sp.]